MAGLSSPLEAAMDRSSGGIDAPWARAAVSWRGIVAAAFLAVLLGAALSRGLAGEHAPALPAAGVGAIPRSGLSSLPLTAQSPVSAAVGALSRVYSVSASAQGLRAVSPPQRLRTRFGRSGVLLSAGAVRVGLSLRAIGFGTSLAALRDVTPSAKDNRVSYARSGLEEWYANGPLGLEQGFTIARAPSGEVAGALTLSMALSGDAHASLSPGGHSIIFSHGGVSALQYTALTATDASGRTLPSWLELHAGRLQLRVDAHGARYPLAIDPLVQQDAKLTAADGNGGFFGFSVALSADGNTALVGAPRDNGVAGVALVFTRSGSTWEQQGMGLVGSEQSGGGTEACVEEPGEEETGCGFGSSVALSADGNTALIGGSRDNGYIGAAWVFTREGSTWTQQGAKLTGGGESFVGHFGRSVALSADGNTALIGGPLDGPGSAWVFTREGSTWNQQGSKLTSGEGEGGGHYFARSVALSPDGQTALIGEPCHAGCTGVAWVFTRAGSTWTRGSRLTGGSEEIGEGRFGFSVALSSDASTAVIGGRSDNEGAGAAWVFTREGSTWFHEGGKLTGGGEARGQAKFGYSVALSADGNTALIGGPGDSGHQGGAWLFTRSGAAWTQQDEKLTGGEEQGQGNFGESVALSSDGETALIGGPEDNVRVGAAWAFAPGLSKGKRSVRPVVTEVSPEEGPTTGGTAVTITGTDLAEATEVAFGKTSAASFVDISATEIAAVSPPGPAGMVKVRVTTPGGTSNPSPGAHFTYFETGTNPGGPPGSNPGGPPGTTSSVTSNVSPGGGVLGFGPFVVPSCTIALRGKTIAVQSYKRAAVKLSWAGVGTCKGKLKLTAKTQSGHTKSGHKRFKTNTIGTGTFSILPGATRTVNVNLNALGRSLLKARHGRLNASIAITKLSPGPAQARTASVRLALQNPHKAKTRKN